MSTKKQKEALLVKLVKSTIGCTDKQKACVRGLGLRKLQSSRLVANTPENKGMINKVNFLLEIKEA